MLNKRKLNIALLMTILLVLLSFPFSVQAAESLYTTGGQLQMMPPHPDLIEKMKEEGKLQDLVIQHRQMMERGYERPAADSRGKKFSSGEARPAVTPAAHALVLCVQFADTEPVRTVAEFQNMMFGSSFGSLKDYFLKNSNGIFSLNGAAIGGGDSGSKQGTVFIKLPQTKEYYVNNEQALGAQYPHNSEGIVVDAVNLLIEAGFDFTPYASNGKIPYLFIIATGNDAAYTGNQTDIWSHMSSLGDNKVTVNISGGTAEVNSYCIQPECSKDGADMATVGVYCHEFGHVLGLPDLYDTANTDTSNGDGNWTLMAGGSWGGPEGGGSVPINLDPFSKTYLGWLNPQNITGTARYTIDSVENAYIQVYQVNPASGQTDYFLLENRQKTGYDQYADGNGLLVWHIDTAMTDPNGEYWLSNEVNNISNGHYGVAIVQADGRQDLEQAANSGDDSDPFPGSANVTAVDDSTNPSTKLFNGSNSNVSITEISENNQIISAVISDGTSAPVETYSISGRVTTAGGEAIPGVSITFTTDSTGTAPEPVITDTSGNYGQSGFQPGTIYRATPSCQGYTFSPTYLEFSSTGTELNFNGTQVAAAPSVSVVMSSSSVPTGTDAVATATATGIESPVYQFWVKSPRDDTWTSSGDFSSSNTYAFTRSVPGAYSVLAVAKPSAGGNTVSSSQVTVTFTKDNSVSDLVVTGPSGSQEVGSSATFTATATDNGGTPLYQFWVHDASGWRVVRDYSADNTYTLENMERGSYVIAVYSLDQEDKDAGRWDMSYYKTFVLNVGSSLTLTAPETVTPGQTVNLSAQSAGLTGVEYQFWYRTPDGAWHGGDYTTSSTYSFTASTAGSYTVAVYAKDHYAPNTADFALTQSATVICQ